MSTSPSPTGTPIIGPQYVPLLIAILTAVNAGLVAIQQSLVSPTSKLVVSVLLASLGPILAALSPGLRKKDGGLAQFQGAKSLKSAALLVALGLFLGAAPARAGGFDWSTGPSIPVLRYDFGSPAPVQVAPGAGLQLSVTHDILKVDLLGKTWDALGVDFMAFGSVVKAGGPTQFGALSGALSVCFMSSLVCAGVGHDILAGDLSVSKTPWFGVLSLNFNWALAPSSGEAVFGRSRWGLPRGNTLYPAGGP